MHAVNGSAKLSAWPLAFQTVGGLVLAELDVVAPPEVLDVALELDAERTIIPGGSETAVDLARLEDEAAPFAKRDDGVEVDHRGNKVTKGRVTGNRPEDYFLPLTRSSAFWAPSFLGSSLSASLSSRSASFFLSRNS